MRGAGVLSRFLPSLPLFVLLLVLVWCAGAALAQESQMTLPSVSSQDKQEPSPAIQFPDNHKPSSAIDIPHKQKPPPTSQFPDRLPPSVVLPDTQKPSSTIDVAHKQKLTNLSTICSQDGCSCENRVARCGCRRKALQLSPGYFTGHDVVELHVRGMSRACLRVVVRPNTFHRSSVKRVKMENLNKVMLRENSFKTGTEHQQFTVDLRNIKELIITSHSFSGSISNISFINTTITSVPDKAFVDTAGQSTVVRFENSSVTRISGQAFSRSRLSRLEFLGCRLGILEPSAISPDQLSDLRLEDCRIRSLQTAALNLSVQMLDVRRCQLEEIAAGALAVRSDRTWLHNNTFRKVAEGAFSQLRAVGGGARLEFHGNRLQEMRPGALGFSVSLTPDQLTVRRLGTEQLCGCQLGGWLRLMAGDAAPDWLLLRLEAAALCRDAAGDDTAFLRFHSQECRGDGPPPAPPQPGWRRYLVGGAVAAALVTVLCAVSCFAVWRQSRRRRQQQRDRAAAADALRHRPHKLNNANLYTDDHSGGGEERGERPESPLRQLVVAVPDVKTYTETEVHVVLETLESMEPTLLPRTPSTGTLQRLRGSSQCSGTGAEQPGCRKSCPL